MQAVGVSDLSDSDLGAGPDSVAFPLSFPDLSLSLFCLFPYPGSVLYCLGSSTVSDTRDS